MTDTVSQIQKLGYLKEYFRIREEKGKDAAMAWAREQTRLCKAEAKEKPHLTSVK